MAGCPPLRPRWPPPPSAHSQLSCHQYQSLAQSCVASNAAVHQLHTANSAAISARMLHKSAQQVCQRQAAQHDLQRTHRQPNFPRLQPRPHSSHGEQLTRICFVTRQAQSSACSDQGLIPAASLSGTDPYAFGLVYREAPPHVLLCFSATGTTLCSSRCCGSSVKITMPPILAAAAVLPAFQAWKHEPLTVQACSVQLPWLCAEAGVQTAACLLDLWRHWQLLHLRL